MTDRVTDQGNIQETINGQRDEEIKPFPILTILWSVVAVFIIALGCVWYACDVDKNQLKNTLALWTVIALDTTLLLFVIGFIASWRSFYELLHSLSQTTKGLLALLLVFSVILVTLVAPRTNRIYFDEHIYQNIAHSITRTGTAYMINEGNAEHGEFVVFVKEYNKQPNGHPYYISVFFRVFGIHEWVAHLANNIAYLIGIISVFGIALILFGCEKAGLFSAMFFALTPLVVSWSSTVAAEPGAVAFTSFAIFMAAMSVNDRSKGLLLMLAAAIGFGITFRPESILLWIPVGLILLLFQPKALLQPRYILTFLLGVLLTIPELLHLYAFHDDPWGNDAAKFGWKIFEDNFPINFGFYWENEWLQKLFDWKNTRSQRFPVIFSVFAVLGFLFAGAWKAKLPIFVWFAYSWGIFLFFYAGSYNYGADDRFSVLSAAPVAIFAGWGARWVSTQLIIGVRETTVSAIVAGIILVFWLDFLPLIRSVRNEAAAARISVEHARKLVHEVPADSIVLTHNPNMWLLWGKNATQTSRATYQKEHVTKHMMTRYSGGVYFHQNYWCNVPNPPQNKFCENIFKNFRTELVKEYPGIHGHKLALFRMYPKEDAGKDTKKDAKTGTEVKSPKEK